MSLYTNQNLFQVPCPVIRVKLTFHSDDPLSLPGDTWHLLEFSKAPLVSDVIEQIKFRFQLSKRHYVTLGMKGAVILKSEKSQIFRDEDTIKVNLIPHTRQHTEHNAIKKAKLTQPISNYSVKRKTAVAGFPPKIANTIQPIKNKPQSESSSSSSSSESSDQPDHISTEKKEKTEIKKSVLFIPRQVPEPKTAAIHSTAEQHIPETSKQIQEDKDSSSSSSEPDASIFLQSVLRGDKHVRFSKKPAQPIRLRPRGRGRGFGRVPPELANRLGPPPPVGRGHLVSAGTDKLRTKNQLFVNAKQQQQQQQQQQPPPSAEKPELQKATPGNYSHLPSVTSDLPPKIGAIIVFKILEMSSEYSPVQSDYRKARVLSYDPNNQMVALEYLSSTILDIERTHSEIQEGKFGMQESETVVQSDESLNLNQLIDPRLLN